MRTFLVALTIGLLTVPCYSAGMSGGGGKKHQGVQNTDDQKKKVEEQKRKAEDNAYNSSLRTIPDRPYDPWRNVR